MFPRLISLVPRVRVVQPYARALHISRVALSKPYPQQVPVKTGGHEQKDPKTWDGAAVGKWAGGIRGVTPGARELLSKVPGAALVAMDKYDLRDLGLSVVDSVLIQEALASLCEVRIVLDATGAEGDSGAVDLPIRDQLDLDSLLSSANAIGLQMATDDEEENGLIRHFDKLVNKGEYRLLFPVTHEHEYEDVGEEGEEGEEGDADDEVEEEPPRRK